MTSADNRKKVVLLDGTPDNRESLAPVLAILRETLAAAGNEVRVFTLRDMKLAHCIGCFGCWIKTPGICLQPDAARDIAEAIVQSGMLVLFTPVTFGGYSPELKLMVDRFVQLTLPCFITRQGEMHHPSRYLQTPRLVAVGVQRQTDDEEAGIFKILVGRNALNFDSPSHAAEVVSLADGAEAIRNRFQALLSKSDPYPLREALDMLPTLPRVAAIPAAPGARRALLIVGSPKVKRPSTSSVLGEHLLECLKQHGWQAESLTLRAGLRKQPEQEGARLLAAVDAADLLVLAFPLYVDSLPFLVTKALDLISRHRLENRNRRAQSLVAIANNGFIDAHQNKVALAICYQFAKQAEITWAGALAMGAGEAVSSGRNLQGWLARYPIIALRMAGEALAEGRPVPPQAVTLISNSPLPPILWRWLFTTIGTRAFRRQALANGISRQQLSNRPYARSAP